jgi:hypothetical protein
MAFVISGFQTSQVSLIINKMSKLIYNYVRLQAVIVVGVKITVFCYMLPYILVNMCLFYPKDGHRRGATRQWLPVCYTVALCTVILSVYKHLQLLVLLKETENVSDLVTIARKNVSDLVTIARKNVSDLVTIAHKNVSDLVTIALKIWPGRRISIKTAGFQCLTGEIAAFVFRVRLPCWGQQSPSKCWYIPNFTNWPFPMDTIILQSVLRQVRSLLKIEFPG